MLCAVDCREQSRQILVVGGDLPEQEERECGRHVVFGQEWNS